MFYGVLLQVDTESIAWVRSKDSHILSVDQDVFVSDPRVVVVHNRDRGEWTLIGEYSQNTGL